MCFFLVSFPSMVAAFCLHFCSCMFSGPLKETRNTIKCLRGSIDHVILLGAHAHDGSGPASVTVRPHTARPAGNRVCWMCATDGASAGRPCLTLAALGRDRPRVARVADSQTWWMCAAVDAGVAQRPPVSGFPGRQLPAALCVNHPAWSTSEAGGVFVVERNQPSAMVQPRRGAARSANSQP